MNRDIFKKDTASKIQSLRDDVNKIDFSGVITSLQFETNERKDENIKQGDQLCITNEKIKKLELKIVDYQSTLQKTDTLRIPSIYESESGELKEKIRDLQNQIIIRNQEIASLREIIKLQEEKINNYPMVDKNRQEYSVNPPLLQKTSSVNDNTINKKKAEILMLFDSNGKYIDRKKVWKLNNSIFRRCGNLYEVNKVIEENESEELKYILQ